MKLSIIIPYYNTKKYTDELLAVLDAQMSDDVEVILIDDGSPEPFVTKIKYPWLTIVWQKHGGASSARNAGLSIAIGEYIAFIDADDLVAKDYIQNIKDCIKRNPDYIELSWKSLTTEGNQFNCRVSNTQELRNPSVCTRIFKRSFIGGLRFNENKDIAEDEEFTRKLKLSRGKRDFIGSYMYFYRTAVPGSMSKKYRKDLTKTKRIIYYIPKVTDKRLIGEFRKEDEYNEVILMCYENFIPELARYCQIKTPCRMWAHELRGEPCKYVEVVKLSVNTQVVLYISGSSGHDGISTFMFNFCQHLKEYYDITILHDYLAINEVNRLRQIVRVVKRGEYPVIICDTLLMMRIADNIPDDVQYKNVFQVVHCTAGGTREIKRELSRCIFVSETAQKTFTDKGRVIYNLSNPVKPERPLIFMSTSRIGASDKGEQDKHLIDFANRLNNEGVNYLWFYFSTNTLPGAPSNMIRIEPVDDVRGFLTRTDYLIHLSENEAYCYSITEALSMGVPVITLNIPVLSELGFVDGKDGYIINDNFDIQKLYKIPHIKPHTLTDDEKAVSEWREVLGDTTPIHNYTPEKMIRITALKPYTDMELNKSIKQGDTFTVRRERADYLKALGLVKEGNNGKV